MKLKHILLALLISLSGFVSAKDFIVTRADGNLYDWWPNNRNGLPGSLFRVIEEVNVEPTTGPHRIIFQGISNVILPMTSNITLSKSNVTIDGESFGLTLDAQNMNLSITGNNVTFKNLTINSDALAEPGLLFEAGTSGHLIDNCTFDDAFWLGKVDPFKNPLNSTITNSTFLKDLSVEGENHLISNCTIKRTFIIGNTGSWPLKAAKNITATSLTIGENSPNTESRIIILGFDNTLDASTFRGKTAVIIGERNTIKNSELYNVANPNISDLNGNTGQWFNTQALIQFQEDIGHYSSIPTKGNIIKNNTLRAVESSTYQINATTNTDGIRVIRNSQNDSILNNRIIGGFWNGIKVSDQSNKEVIHGNTINGAKIDGIRLINASNNIITNNVSFNHGNATEATTFIEGIGIRIQENSNTNIVRGNITFDNLNDGIRIEKSNNNIIDSNITGLDTLGLPRGNKRYGIAIIDGAASNKVGANFPNYISSNIKAGVNINKSTFNEVYNNFIGRVSVINGSDLGANFENNGPAILIDGSASSNIIGAANKGNIIGYKQNTSGVIKVDGTGPTPANKNKIQGNSTFCNAGKGIELSNNGNNGFGLGTLFINRASSATNEILVTAPAGTKYYDIYIADTACSPTCSSSGAGSVTQRSNSQGKIFTRRVDLSTILSTKNTLEDYTIALIGNERSHNVTVTATDNSNNTSEFAQCRHEVLCADPVVTNVNTTGDNNNGFCDGTSIDITVSVNSNDVSYAWTLNNNPVNNGTSGTLNVSESGTYVLTISDNADPSTCNIDTSITVTKYDNPDLSVISGPNAACLDTDDKLTFSVKDLGPNHSYTWSHEGSVTGTKNSGDTSYTASNFNKQPTSKVTVTAVNDVTTCSDEATFDVTIHDNPLAEKVTGLASVQCDDKGIEYSVETSIPDADADYVWSVTGPGAIAQYIGDSSSVKIDFNGTSTETEVQISVIVTNNKTGCVSDASTPLTVKLVGCNLNPDFTANTDACINTSLANNEVTFSDLSTNGNGVKIVKWEWNFGANATPPSATDNVGNAGKGIDQTVKYSTIGQKTVSLTVTDEEGGIKTITKDDFITINDVPNISAITGPDAACLDASDKQTYSVTDLGGDHIYTWTHDGSTQGTATDFSYVASNFNKQPTAKVYLIVLDNTTGCSDSTNKDVTVNDNPTAEVKIENDKVQCGATGINYEVQNPSSDLKYEWTITGPGSIVNSNQDSTNITLDFNNANSSTGYVVNIVVTAINKTTGCQSKPSTPLQVQLIGCGLEANFNADTNACLNTSIENNTHIFSDASSNDAGVKIVKWVWDFGTGATPSTITDELGDGNGKGLDQTVSYSTTGSKTITLTVTDENGGTNTVTKADYLTVYDNPNISTISGPDNACFDTDDKLTYTVEDLGGDHTYTWTHDGSTQGTKNSGDTSYTASNFNKQPISKVYLTVKDNLLGCADSTSKNITVNDIPVVDSISGENKVTCGAKGITYTAHSTVANVKYEWIIEGPGSIVSANSDSSTITIDFAQANSNTGYDVNIRAIAINTTGCMSDPSTPFTVNLIGCGLEANFDSDTTVCLNTSLLNNEITFTDKSVNIDGGAIVEWKWDFGVGAIPQTITDVVGNGSGKGLNQKVTYTSAGTKTVSLTVTDLDGAENTITKTDFLTVHSNPVSRVIDGDPKLCENTIGEYFVINSDETETYNWSAPNADKIISTFKLDTATVKAASSNFNVNVNVVDSNGCSIAYTPFPIEVISELNSVDITKVPTFACTDNGRLNAYQFDAFTSGGNGTANYVWTTTPALDTLVQKYGADYNDSTSQSLIMKFGTYTGNVTFTVKASPKDNTCKNEPIDFDQTIVHPSHPVKFEFTKPPTCIDDSSTHIVKVSWLGERPEPTNSDEEVIGNYHWIRNSDTISRPVSPIFDGTNRWTNTLNDTVNSRPKDNDTITVLPITGDTLILTSDVGFCYDLEKSKLTDTLIFDLLDRPGANLHITSKDTEKFINFDGSTTVDVNEFSFVDPILKLPFVELKDKTTRFTNDGLIFTFENVVSVDSFNVINRQQTTDFIDIVPTDQKQQKYTLTYKLSVDNGVCFDTSYAKLNIEFDYFIPNAFTPNEDGAFDTWQIENLEKYEDVKVTIYNRWGSLVYDNNSYDNSWSGVNNNGDKLPFGTYFYIVDFNIDGLENRSGSVSIIK